MPVGKVAVPKTGKRIGTLPFLDRSAGRSSRGDCSEVPVGKIAVPKTVQKSRSPRRDASGAPMGGVAVPKTERGPPRHVGMPLMCFCHRSPRRRGGR